MKKIINSLAKTNPNNSNALIARIFLFVVMFPHGAQKLFGWFGGYGWKGTMDYLISVTGTPAFILTIVFLTESIGMVLLLLGLGTRLISGLLIIAMAGAVFVGGHTQYFFMNWFGNQTIEGFEFHLLVIGLALITLLSGGGKLALDYKLKVKYDE